MRVLLSWIMIVAAVSAASPAFAQTLDDRRDREARRDLLVPAVCLEDFQTRAGKVSVYTAECLRRSHIENIELPVECRISFRAEGQRVWAYQPDCLERAGYRLVRQ